MKRAYEKKVKTFKIIVAIWIVYVCASAIFTVLHNNRLIYKSAEIQARALFLKDVIYRHWNASNGGVYAEVNATNQPNYYLKDIPERDITTPSGKKLTLINPAYMTRQVHELGAKQYGFYAHITSLNPIRPENKANEWETQALLKFEKGVKEVSSVVVINDEKYLNLMQPLITEKACLKCHRQQGYKLGDIRGGIRVSVPLKPLKSAALFEELEILILFIVILTIGILGIFWVKKNTEKELNYRLKTKAELHKSHVNLEEAQHIGDFGSWEWNVDNSNFYYSKHFCELFNVTNNDDHLENILNNVVHKEDRKILAELLDSIFIKHRNHECDFRIINKGLKYIHARCRMDSDAEGRVVHVYGSMLNNTRQKNIENKLADINENLELIVKERTQELEASNEELKTSLEEQQTLVEELDENNRELARLNDLFVGREFRIKELRDEIERLKNE